MQTEEIRKALQEAVIRAGSQTELARQAGMNQGRISDYLRGQCAVGNITADTLLRLFPELQMSFFDDDHSKHKTNNVKVGGAMTGFVVQGGKVSQVTTGAVQSESHDAINRRDLERKIRKSNRFTAEEQIKILDFLDDEM